MSIQKTVFSVGEPVNVTLTLTNISNQNVTISVDMWLLDFVVSNSTNNLIYQHTNDGAMAQWVMLKTLQPGENVTDSYAWSQRYSGPNPGPAVSPGTYYIAGKSPGIGDLDTGYLLQTTPLEIMIVNNG